MKCIVLIMLFFHGVLAGFSREYHIRAAGEINNVMLLPGDKVVLTDSSWRGQALQIRGAGTASLPILITVQVPGKLRLTGNSSLQIDGSYINVDGLFFTGEANDRAGIVSFSGASSHCRVTNTAIVATGRQTNETALAWVSLAGSYNRVDHCWFEGKPQAGPAFFVHAAANYARVDHNYFGKRTATSRGKSGTLVEIGSGGFSTASPVVELEGNVFDRCNSSLDLIVQHSGNTVFKNNLFYQCTGAVVLEPGTASVLSNNSFIGNGLPGTGGIRLNRSACEVHENYFDGLTGAGNNAALALLDSAAEGKAGDVPGASISANIFYHCSQAVWLGRLWNIQEMAKASYNFTGNTIVGVQEPVSSGAVKVAVKFSENISWGMKEPVTIRKGFLVKDPGLQRTAAGMRTKKGQGSKASWQSQPAGPAWKKGLYRVMITG